MTTGRKGAPGEEPRTDLPPRREPYEEGWFGTGEEEGVVREEQEDAPHERHARVPDPGEEPERR